MNCVADALFLAIRTTTIELVVKNIAEVDATGRLYIPMSVQGHCMPLCTLYGYNINRVGVFLHRLQTTDCGDSQVASERK